MSYHHQNLSDGKLPLWRYGRAWWGRLHWGWGFFKPTSLLLVGVGLRGACVYLRSFHFYVSWGDYEGEHGRWEVGWSDGALRIEHPWVRPDGWCRSDPWWKHAIRLPIVDWLLGREECTTRESQPVDVFVPMPEGSYRAVATAVTHVLTRRWYWPSRRRESVWLGIPGGIPHSGKGENSYDCGDDGLWAIGGDTIDEAIGNAVASVLRSRRRHGHDSKGTGIVPVAVVNAKDGQP